MKAVDRRVSAFTSTFADQRANRVTFRSHGRIRNRMSPAEALSVRTEKERPRIPKPMIVFIAGEVYPNVRGRATEGKDGGERSPVDPADASHESQSPSRTGGSPKAGVVVKNHPAVLAQLPLWMIQLRSKLQV
jgi:hypothetical protein